MLDLLLPEHSLIVDSFISKRAQVLLELASGLAPSLDEEAISLLYRSTKPLVLDDASPQLQKRAYKVRRGS